MSLTLATCIAALVAAVCAAIAVWRVRGSTAVPAAWWAVAACLALAYDAGSRVDDPFDPARAARMRLAVAALAVCPAMSLLGAKRPQHGVWQLIVASLAVVIAMPALSAWLVRPGSLPDVHLLGRGFLALLAVVGWMNFVATGNGPAATLIAAGQLAVIRPFLPGIATDRSLPQDLLDCCAACLIAAGTVLAAAWPLVRRRRVAVAHAADAVSRSIDPPFLALRETLGAAWALRIAERFDSVASDRGWPCRLTFRGADVGGDPADTSWHRDALRAFKALMNRFVDDGWLARHGWGG
ncbi:MAG: hypothetical protein ACK52C_07660 [Planctomycetia bacterium]